MNPKPKDARINVWSCGGGTQSAAIAALIITGRLPKPDLAVMVDTGREKSGTWQYMDDVLAPNLWKHGVNLSVVRAADWAKDQAPIFYTSEEGKETMVLPMFTTQNRTASGEAGKVANLCSGLWKRDVISPWLRSQGVQRCRSRIGISTNEMSRVRQSRRQWNQNCYPLLEAEFGLYMSRNDCLQLVTEKMGWPVPPRSACWMCPNQSDDEWREMRRDYPGDFAQAIALEREVRARDPHFFCHPSCVPLDEVDFDKPRPEGLFGAVGGCDSGYCFT